MDKACLLLSQPAMDAVWSHTMLLQRVGHSDRHILEANIATKHIPLGLLCVLSPHICHKSMVIEVVVQKSDRLDKKSIFMSIYIGPIILAQNEKGFALKGPFSFEYDCKFLQFLQTLFSCCRERERDSVMGSLVLKFYQLSAKAEDKSVKSKYFF